jgi:hypothetical protein
LSWDLRSIGVDLGLLRLNTKRLRLEIEIRPLKTTLIAPNLKEFKDIIDKPLDPMALLMELHRSGVNILPTAKDVDNSGLGVDLETEERCC